MRRFKNILYVADSSGLVLKAFHHAVGLAERNNARLTAIVVMDAIPPYLTRLTPHMFRQARIAEMQAALDKLASWAKGRVEVETKILEGKIFLEVIRDVLRNGRDLAIKSADGDVGAVGRLLGTTDMHLVRKCPCPVWLMKSNDPSPVRRVMACVDFNDLDPPDRDTAKWLNRMILEMAGSIAFHEHGKLDVVHAWQAIGEDVMRSRGRSGAVIEEIETYVDEVRLKNRQWLDQLLRKARDWLGPATYDAVEPKTHMPKGMAGEIIPALARELGTDLIVMGTVARTGIPGFIIGNTAESVLSEIDCSVLAVKPPGFVTPVTLED